MNKKEHNILLQKAEELLMLGRAELLVTRKAHEDAVRDVVRLNQENAVLEHELEQARLPWWRRWFCKGKD